MTGSPPRGLADGGLWQAGCKDCQAEQRTAEARAEHARAPKRANRTPGSTQFAYSDAWADRMLERGNSRSDRCERHRIAHKKAIQAIAVPYVSLQVIGEVLDPKHPTGPLGGLGALPVTHHRTRISVDLADYEFGMSDADVMRLLEGLRTHQVAVVEAGTGTGKSTFMPFRLMRPPKGALSLSKYGPIVVTEPRLAATKGVARFVGEELCFGHDSRACSSHIGPGFSVGYQVKGEKAWDAACELIYVTDGTMINWLRDGQLARIGAIIVDEAHERSENIDIILAQLRDRIHQYKHLRVIIASATLDKTFFVEYFGGAERVFHLSVPAAKSFGYGVPLFPDLTFSDQLIEQGVALAGQGGVVEFSGWAAQGPEQEGYETEDLRQTTYHLASLRCVETFPLTEWKDRMPAAVAKQVVAIARGTKWGDILAFLPTSASIQTAVADITARLKREGLAAGFDIYPLLSTIDKNTIDKATGARKRGDKRKIVVSSNFAETSLTVKGVRYVVDSGLICQPEWDPDIASGSYPTKPHSQSGVRQRWGRVGRDAPGWVFPLYSTEQFLSLPLNTPPGSAQTNLETFYLKLMAAGLDADAAVLPTNFRHDAVVYDSEALKTIETFGKECRRARHALRLAGAVDSEGHLTDYGREIERFPGDGSEALAFMLAEQLACVHEVALALAVLSNSRLFGRGDSILGINPEWPISWRVEAMQRHRALAHGCIDDLDLLLRVYHLWYSAADAAAWCDTWWVNENAVKNGWVAAMEYVRSLSAAMKGEAERAPAPELAERARAVLTRAMVGIRYARSSEGTFQSLNTTTGEPPTAQLSRGELVEPGDRLLAFGRRRILAKDDGPSCVYISHVVRMIDWAIAGDSTTTGLDLVLRCANQISAEPERLLDPLRAARKAVPAGATIRLTLAPLADGIHQIQSLHVVTWPSPLPKTSGLISGDEENFGFARDWDPLGRTTAEVPDEELSNVILDSRRLENDERLTPPPSQRGPRPPSYEYDDETGAVAFAAKSAWPLLPLESRTAGRVVAYERTGAGQVVLVIEPLALSVSDAYHNNDLQLGQEVSVSVCGSDRYPEPEYVQLVRRDRRGYIFLDAAAGGLGYYDRSFAAGLVPGSVFTGIAVPDGQDGVTVTLLPALHAVLARYPADMVVVGDESSVFYAATVIDGPNKWGKVDVVLDQQGDTGDVSFRFEVLQREFRGHLFDRAVRGQQLLVALAPESGRNRGELDVREVPQALAFVKAHPEVFCLNGGRITIRVPNVSLALIRELASAGGDDRWQRDVWRFYAASLRLTVSAVRAKPRMLQCPAAIASLIRERRIDAQQRYEVSLQTEDLRISMIGDPAKIEAAERKLNELSALPRVVAKLPPNTAGRVLGKGHENRKRLEALPGVTWVWVDGDTVGIIAEAARAIDTVLAEIRRSVESATGELNIPSGMNGRLIGKGGATIKGLKTTTGCNARNIHDGPTWQIDGPNASAVQSFIRQATSIVGGSGSVTSIKELRIVEDTRRPYTAVPAAKTASSMKRTPAGKKALSDCFIATACYGDPSHPDVRVLREWRDLTLRHSRVGRCFIAVYYVVTPPVARFVETRRTLAAIGRFLISTIIRLIRWHLTR